MNAKLKCSARIIGTPHGITLSKPDHCHEPMDFPEQKQRRIKAEKYNELYTEYPVHE